MVKIYDTDTYLEMAKKIYEHLEVNCSVSVFGFLTVPELSKVVPKGEMVLIELEKLYDKEYMTMRGPHKSRKYRFRDKSIGGPVLHPIFTWEKRVVDGKDGVKEVRYTIWKVQ
jgi:hypothetical protein